MKRSERHGTRRSTMESHGESGWSALSAGELDPARDHYKQAIEVARQLEATTELAVFLSYLGVVELNLGDLEEAERHLTESIDIARGGSLTEIEEHSRLLLAELLRDCGRSDQAIDQFLEAISLAVKLDDFEAAELALANLGRLYLAKGWAEQAVLCFNEALELRDETRDKPALLGSMGLCMSELGKFDKAIGHFRTAYLEAECEDDVRTMAISRGSEGNTLFELHQYDDALKCYEMALELSRHAEDSRREGVWLGNIGTTWLKLGDVDKALENCQKAAEIARAFDDQQSEAAHLDSIGDCYFARGELEQAHECYGKALEISEQVQDRLGQRIYLTNLGKLFERMGQLQPAFEHLGRAADLFDHQRARIKADDLKTSFANRGGDLYKDVVRVCLSLGKRVEALEYVGRAKSRALLDLLSNSPIDISTLSESGDQGLKKLILQERQLRAQIDHLERVFWQGGGSSSSGSDPGSGYRGAARTVEEAQGLYSTWRDVVSQLKRRHPNYATLVSSTTLGFSEIKQLWETPDAPLGRDTVLIEYFWTEDFLMAACIDAESKEPGLHILADAEAREGLAMDLETFLEMSSTEGWEVPLSLCQRLYDLLLKPLVETFPQGIERLMLVPHGSLFHLPFAALHDGEGFLCQKYCFSYLPSTSLIPVLARARGAMSEAQKAKYLVSAISDYSATRKDGLVFSSTLRSSAGLDDLSYTVEEARSILKVGSEAASEAKLLTNEEVKTNLAALFSEYPVVHFAGHAIFNPEEPMASGLVLSDGTVLTAASILERSSLRTKCGRLLVLSACQTGVNLITPGGEILGLARALMYAGMPNLVLSLWEVADRSTADLMQDFHSAWQAGKQSISKALQEAQRNAANTGQPIHAWAPFIHFGID